MTVIPAGDPSRARYDTGTASTVTPVGEHLYLVHSGSRPPVWLTRLAGRLGPTRPNEAVVVVGVPSVEDGAEGLGRLLAPALEACRDAQVRLLTLVMSEGAHEAGDSPSPARLIIERWGMDVLATAGSALVTTAGCLFAPGHPGGPGGWWHFSPGSATRHVSSHLPIPDWEIVVRRVGRQVLAGHIVEPVPAGLAVRPAGPVSPATHARLHAVPPEYGRPQLIVTSPRTPAAVLAVVLGALPEQVRGSLRLVSLAGVPMSRTAQGVSDLLGREVDVAVGVPVMNGRAVPEGVSAGDAAADQYLLDEEGRPAWRPFARTLVHGPSMGEDNRPARVTQWRVPAVLSGTEPDALSPGRDWKACVTPSGLWIGPRDAEPPFLVTARPARADAVAIDLGPWDSHGPLDDSLWPELGTLFAQLEPEVCVRAVVHVHGVLDARDDERLRGLTVRHGLRHADSVMSHRPEPVGRP
ncbi:hypothetical protein AB0L10_39225 [Streptomyces flaveolus]|uniref:hypothetical protein n=1 Tax=Streptomyces flaveolus TaxID=67297 RepID=UPI00343ED85D